MEEFPKITRPAADRERPLLISSPHSGTLIPAEEQGFYRESPEGLARDGDLHVDKLYAGAEGLGATLISTPYSRFLIDLNRLPDDVTPGAVRGMTTPRGKGYYGERGLIWTVGTRGSRIYQDPLTLEHFQERRTCYYDPYHQALRDELERLRARFGYAILLDAHSMPSRATRHHPDPGKRRADIVPGDLHGQSCGGWLSVETLNFWKEAGFKTVPNAPYSGGGIIRQHGRPQAHIHAIQLEVNRALYMDEETLEPHEGLARLRSHCLRFAERLAKKAPPR